MQKLKLILFSLAFVLLNAACAQNHFATTQSGGVYTVKGFGSFGGLKDDGKLYRYNTIQTGNYGLSAYFQSLSNSAQSQTGLGLVSDELTTLKGKRKSLYALFVNGTIEIRHRATDTGVMSVVSTVQNVPLPAYLKIEVLNGNATFSYSANGSTWVAISGTQNISNWGSVRKTIAVGSSLTTAQTAIVSAVNHLQVGGSSAYNLAGITVSQSPGNVTRFNILPNETNRPSGVVNYALVVKDAANVVAYNDQNISLNTSLYPTIDFTPSSATATPRLTAAGTYNVCLTANGLTQCQSVAFSAAQLGIQTSGGGGSSNCAYSVTSVDLVNNSQQITLTPQISNSTNSYQIQLIKNSTGVSVQSQSYANGNINVGVDKQGDAYTLRFTDNSSGCIQNVPVFIPEIVFKGHTQDFTRGDDQRFVPIIKKNSSVPAGKFLLEDGGSSNNYQNFYVLDGYPTDYQNHKTFSVLVNENEEHQINKLFIHPNITMNTDDWRQYYEPGQPHYQSAVLFQKDFYIKGAGTPTLSLPNELPNPERFKYEKTITDEFVAIRKLPTFSAANDNQKKFYANAFGGTQAYNNYTPAELDGRGWSKNKQSGILYDNALVAYFNSLRGGNGTATIGNLNTQE